MIQSCGEDTAYVSVKSSAIQFALSFSLNLGPHTVLQWRSYTRAYQGRGRTRAEALVEFICALVKLLNSLA